jgi:hypothetical protein
VVHLTDTGRLTSLVEGYMKDIFATVNAMVLVLANTRTLRDMSDNGKMARCMERVHGPIPMEQFTKADL